MNLLNENNKTVDNASVTAYYTAIKRRMRVLGNRVNDLAMEVNPDNPIEGMVAVIGDTVYEATNQGYSLSEILIAVMTGYTGCLDTNDMGSTEYRKKTINILQEAITKLWENEICAVNAARATTEQA